MNPIKMVQGKGTSELLLHFDGPNGQTKYGDYGRYGHKQTVEPVAPLGLSTAIAPKFGSACMRCDQLTSGSFTRLAALSLAQDFTTECFANFQVLSGQEHTFLDMYNTGGRICHGFGVYGVSSSIGHLILYNYTTGQNFTASSDFSISLGVWHHFAVSKQSSTVRFFFDGNLVSSATVSGTLLSTDGVHRIGHAVNTGAYYLDELRMLTGQALYTASFTPPSTPFVS